MTESDSSRNPGRRAAATRFDRLIQRFPAVVPVLAAAGVLGFFQAAFLISQYKGVGGGTEMVIGFARFSIIAAVATLLMLLPAVLVLRRLHAGWRCGDREGASWAACFGLVMMLSAWMFMDRWSAGIVRGSIAPWLAVIVALAVGLAASWLKPPRSWLRAGAVCSLIYLVLAFTPIGPGLRPPSNADQGAKARTKERARPTANMPDVVLVSIDTLRADRLGAYGRSPSLTPEIDRLAREGVVCRRALAAAPWTIPSVASMLTGLSSVRHGAGRAKSSGLNFMRSPLGHEHETLAERLASAGYDTRAVVANGFLSAETGMDQGFDQFRNTLNEAMAGDFFSHLPQLRLIVRLVRKGDWGDVRAESVTNIALSWLEEETDTPLFLWVHYNDLHAPLLSNPHAPPTELIPDLQAQPRVLADGTIIGEEFGATIQVRGGLWWLISEDRIRIEDYYDRAVSYVDQSVGRLFDALRARRSRRDVIAAVTADHGEEFWDHGHFEHGHDYYREVTWVPLIFWDSRAVPAGRVVDDVVGLVDVPATLLDMTDLEPLPSDAPDDGRSLAPLWREEDGVLEPLPRFAGGNLYQLPAVLVEDGPWRLILRANDKVELYDVTQDPDERYNVALEHPDVVARLRQMLEPRLADFLQTGNAESAQLTPEQIKALRSLGYTQ